MFVLYGRAVPRPNAAPQCRCYARIMVKDMSPAEINAVAAGYPALPLHSGKVMAACATRIAAAQRAHAQPARSRDAAPAARPSEAAPVTPTPAATEAPAAADAPAATDAPAANPAPTAPAESETPKSE